jgi:hypothetical protein
VSPKKKVKRINPKGTDGDELKAYTGYLGKIERTKKKGDKK